MWIRSVHATNSKWGLLNRNISLALLEMLCQWTGVWWVIMLAMRMRYQMYLVMMVCMTT